MKITVMNLDYPSMFYLKTFHIHNEGDLERIQGFSGSQLYVRADEEDNDPPAMVSAVRQIIEFHYNDDFIDAAIKLFKIVEKMLKLQAKEMSNG